MFSVKKSLEHNVSVSELKCFSMGSRLRPYMSDNGPLILDGGLATELEAQGRNLQVKHNKE